MLRNGQGDGRPARGVEHALNVGLDFLGRKQPFGLEVQQLVLQDANAAEVILNQKQLETLRTGINGQHAAEREGFPSGETGGHWAWGAGLAADAGAAAGAVAPPASSS